MSTVPETDLPADRPAESSGRASFTSGEDTAQRFIHRTLPWIVGGVALLVFAFTLNRWVNLRSLPIVSKVWEGTPPSQSPLFYAITYPLRFFPMALQPLLLNIFTALCGGLTIALLARSVALLPHDRTHEQRVRERSELSLLSIPFAWAPVILAAGACAFQLTFWENATAATGELFDLALFAYVIRSLLEYRISQNDSWLFKAALVYGLSIPNNWAMIGFFPLFLGAIVWIKGIRFFDPSFLIRMALLGMAGLLIYLLLPLAWTLRGQSEMSFFEILRASWLGQKLYLADIPNLRNRAFLLGLTSVLPVVVMGIRWRSSSGDISAAGASLTTLAFRVIHLFFLAACLFVCFDIKFSPRSRTASGAELGLGLPFLTFYYLGALAIGYYSGYALLVFTDPPRKGWRHDNPLAKILNPLVRFVVLVAAISVPLGLLYRNYAPIRAGDGTVLKEFTARTLEGLPAQPAYLLSEDAYQLSMLQAALAPTDRRDQYAMVNTRLLENPAYHEKLHRQYGPRWPLMGSREDLGQRVGQADLQLYVTALSVSNLVIYLHPSFGYFFERMYAEPNGQTLRLHPFHREEILPPPLTPDQLQKNEAFWRDASDYLKRIEALEKYDSLDAQYLAKYYSRALNNWGVSLQRSEKLADAGNDFARAADLNTNNIPAKFNRAFNEAVQKGRTVPSENGKGLEEKFGNYRTWDTMLGDNGPFDQPEFCQSLGEFFVNQFQYRQAALQFSRAVHFQPTNFVARIALARAYVAGQWIPRAIAELDGIDREFKELPSTNRLDIISLRAGAAFAAGDFPRAEGLLKNAVAQNPDESAASQALVELYRGAGHYTNAIAVLDEALLKNPTNTVVLLQKAELQVNLEQFDAAHRTLDRLLSVTPRDIPALLFQAFSFIQEKKFDQALLTVDKVLREDPENFQALTAKGIAHMELKDNDSARAAFDRVLRREPDNPVALRNRALLNVRTQRWGEAKDDYEHLEKLTPRAYAVMYGLADVAYNLKEYKKAARLYQDYLKYAPAKGTPELEEEKTKVRARLKEIESAPHQ